MGWRILKKHFIKTIETCLCMKGENTMRDLKDEIFFDYDSYDDLLEDIQTTGHVFFIFNNQLYYINPEKPCFALRDDRAGEIIRTFKSEEELLDAKFLDGKTLKEAFNDLQFIDW